MLEHLAEITAVDPAAAARAPHEMLGLGIEGLFGAIVSFNRVVAISAPVLGTTQQRATPAARWLAGVG